MTSNSYWSIVCFGCQNKTCCQVMTSCLLKGLSSVHASLLKGLLSVHGGRAHLLIGRCFGACQRSSCAEERRPQ